MDDTLIVEVWKLDATLLAIQSRIQDLDNTNDRERLQTMYTQALTKALTGRTTPTTKTTLARLVRDSRRANDLTMQQLADAVDMSKTWIADLERGRHLPTARKRLAPIATALGLDWKVMRDIADQEAQIRRDQADKP